MSQFFYELIENKYLPIRVHNLLHRHFRKPLKEITVKEVQHLLETNEDKRHRGVGKKTELLLSEILNFPIKKTKKITNFEEARQQFK